MILVEMILAFFGVMALIVLLGVPGVFLTLKYVSWMTKRFQ